MKHIFNVFLLMLISVQLHSQTEKLNDYYSQNGFFLEGLGRAGLFSINYERRIPITQAWKIAPQIGVGLIPFGLQAPLAVPVGVTGHFGKKAHQIEFGGGATFIFEDNSGTGVVQYPGYKRTNEIGTLYLGYRYERPLGGLMFRIGYTPLFGKAKPTPSGGTTDRFYHWAGISIGYAMPNFKTKKTERPPY